MEKKKRRLRASVLADEKRTSGQAEAEARSRPTNIIRGERWREGTRLLLAVRTEPVVDVCSHLFCFFLGPDIHATVQV